jgi:hypothetical protein
MIPEAFHKGGSASVMPVVLGFLFALYLSLEEAASKPAQGGAMMERGLHRAVSGHSVEPGIPFSHTTG